MFPNTVRRWRSLGLLIVLSLVLPARATAAAWQDLGNTLPAGSQIGSQTGADEASRSGAGSTLDQEIRLIADRFAGWQQAGAGQKVERLDDQLRAHWVMVDDNGLLSGRILIDREKLQQAFSEAANPPSFQQYAESNLASSNCNCNGGEAGYPPSGSWAMNGGYEYGTPAQTISYYRNPENPNAGRVPMQVFLLNRGNLIAMDEVDPEGRFQFQGVKPGSYSLVGYGLSGFFAFGLNILSFADGAQVPTEILATPINLSGPPITGWVKRAAPSVHFRIRGQHRFGQGRDDPPRLYGLDGLQTFMPVAAPATSLGGQPTALTADGRLLGRLHYINGFDGRPADLQTTGVQLIRDGKMVKQTATDNYGVFEFRDIEPGTYGILAVGPDGLGALQVTVVAANQGPALPIDLALLEDTSTGFVNHFMIETAYWSGLSPPSPEKKQDDECGGVPNMQGGSGCPLLDMFHTSYAP